MGVSKTELFNEEQNAIAQMAKVLAHPARVAIVQHLIKLNACVNGDFVKELGLAQPTVSQHLRELKETGLLKGSVEGKRVNYCIDKEQWDVFAKQFDAFFASINKINSCK